MFMKVPERFVFMEQNLIMAIFLNTNSLFLLPVQVADDEVEYWIVRAIAAKLLEAKMDQLRQVVIIGYGSIDVDEKSYTLWSHCPHSSGRV